MSVFSAHVVLQRGPDFVRFAPGDTLPEWAASMVGDHCLGDSPKAPVEAVKADPEPVAEAPAKTAAPDFTKPATKRGRSRKDS